MKNSTIVKISEALAKCYDKKERFEIEQELNQLYLLDPQRQTIIQKYSTKEADG